MRLRLWTFYRCIKIFKTSRCTRSYSMILWSTCGSTMATKEAVLEFGTSNIFYVNAMYAWYQQLLFTCDIVLHDRRACICMDLRVQIWDMWMPRAKYECPSGCVCGHGRTRPWTYRGADLRSPAVDALRLVEFTGFESSVLVDRSGVVRWIRRIVSSRRQLHYTVAWQVYKHPCMQNSWLLHSGDNAQPLRGLCWAPRRLCIQSSHLKVLRTYFLRPEILVEKIYKNRYI